MKAEIGIEDGRPFLNVKPDSWSESSLLEYLRPFMPFVRYEDGQGTVRILGERLPGSGTPVTSSFVDAIADGVVTLSPQAAAARDKRRGL